MKKLTPRQRRQARTKEEILEAALTLINESGPDKLSLRALAKRVDYSPAGLYEYFDGKDDIIEAVCAESDRRLQAQLHAVPATLPPDEYLVELGIAYLKYARQHEEQFRLMFSHVFEGPPIPYEAIGEQETFKIIIDAVQLAIDAGMIDTSDWNDLIEIAYGLWSVAHGMAILRLTNLRNVEADFEAADRATLEAFVSGLQSR
jgi:AcrR family transcriptional regulator